MVVEVKVEVESNLGAPLGQPLLAGVAGAPWVAGGPQSTGAGPSSSSPCLSSSSLLELASSAIRIRVFFTRILTEEEWRRRKEDEGGERGRRRIDRGKSEGRRR